MILGAVYMLWMYQRVFLGKVTNPANNEIPDLEAREKLILVPIVILMLWMGVYSSPFLRRMDSSMDLVLKRIEAARGQRVYRVQTHEGNIERERLAHGR
jgi:NADH-quinone oxidoreductase subunit M